MKELEKPYYVSNVVTRDTYFTDHNVFCPNQNASSKKYYSFMIPKRSSALITLQKHIREKRQFIVELRKKGIVPVLRDNMLCVYRVSVKSSKELARISDEYRGRFETNSKILALIDLIGQNYIDLEFLFAQASDFLYSSKSYYNASGLIYEERDLVEQMSFTDKERALSEDEKRRLIEDIISSFDIECIYNGDINFISDKEIESIFGAKYREEAVKFARQNARILDEARKLKNEETQARAKAVEETFGEQEKINDDGEEQGDE